MCHTVGGVDNEMHICDLLVLTLGMLSMCLHVPHIFDETPRHSGTEKRQLIRLQTDACPTYAVSNVRGSHLFTLLYSVCQEKEMF